MVPGRDAVVIIVYKTSSLHFFFLSDNKLPLVQFREGIKSQPMRTLRSFRSSQTENLLIKKKKKKKKKSSYP